MMESGLWASIDKREQVRAMEETRAKGGRGNAQLFACLNTMKSTLGSKGKSDEKLPARVLGLWLGAYASF